jgi:hypothetical protein
MQWDPRSIVARVPQPLQFVPHSLELSHLLVRMCVQPTQSCVNRVAFLLATMVSQCDMVRCTRTLFGTVNCNLVSFFNSEFFKHDCGHTTIPLLRIFFVIIPGTQLNVFIMCFDPYINFIKLIVDQSHRGTPQSSLFSS